MTQLASKDIGSITCSQEQPLRLCILRSGTEVRGLRLLSLLSSLSNWLLLWVEVDSPVVVQVTLGMGQSSMTLPNTMA